MIDAPAVEPAIHNPEAQGLMWEHNPFVSGFTPDRGRTFGHAETHKRIWAQRETLTLVERWRHCTDLRRLISSRKYIISANGAARRRLRTQRLSGKPCRRRYSTPSWTTSVALETTIDALGGNKRIVLDTFQSPELEVLSQSAPSNGYLRSSRKAPDPTDALKPFEHSRTLESCCTKELRSARTV